MIGGDVIGGDVIVVPLAGWRAAAPLSDALNAAAAAAIEEVTRSHSRGISRGGSTHEGAAPLPAARPFLFSCSAEVPSRPELLVEAEGLEALVSEGVERTLRSLSGHLAPRWPRRCARHLTVQLRVHWSAAV